MLVLWVDGSDAIVAAVTTAGPRGETDIALADWHASGLARPSFIRLMRLDAFANSRLIRRIGMISRQDANSVNAAWATHMRLQL